MVLIKFNRNETIHVDENSSVAQLKIKFENSKFIYKGKLLQDDDLFVLPEYKITKITTPTQVLDKIQKNDAMSRFSKENYHKYKVTPNYVQKKTDYNLEVLQEFSDSLQAQRLLTRIVEDVGIKEIMTRRQFVVHKIMELHPRQKNILGYNQNKGSVIALRLRTDDLTGFRHYNSIIKVMLHELCHNIHSNHDADFHKLNKDLNQEWEKSKGRTISSGAIGSFPSPVTSKVNALGGRPVAGDQREIMYEAAMKRLNQEDQEITDQCCLD